MANEWKIDTWFKKTCFVLGAIGGAWIMLSFLIGFIYGFIIVMTGI